MNRSQCWVYSCDVDGGAGPHARVSAPCESSSLGASASAKRRQNAWCVIEPGSPPGCALR